MTLILIDGSLVPVPNGYTLERVLEILQEMGLIPVQIRREEGTTTDLKIKAA